MKGVILGMMGAILGMKGVYPRIYTLAQWLPALRDCFVQRVPQVAASCQKVAIGLAVGGSRHADAAGRTLLSPGPWLAP